MRTKLIAFLLIALVGSAFAVRGYDVVEEAIHSYDTSDGNFRIWWSTAGGQALQDPADGNGNGIPDQIEFYAQALEFSMDYFTNETNWEDPVRDGDWYPSGYDYGGDDKIDVYVRSLGAGTIDDFLPYPAATFPEFTDPDTTEDDVSFHINVTNLDLVFEIGEDSFDYTKEAELGLAYSLFTAFLYSIDYDESSHLISKSCEWAAEMVYPEYNLYHDNRLADFFAEPSTSLTSDSSALFAHFLYSLGMQDSQMSSLVSSSDYDNALEVLWMDYCKRTAEEDYNFSDAVGMLWTDVYQTESNHDPHIGPLGEVFTTYTRWNWFTDHRSAADVPDNNLGYYYIDDNNGSESNPKAYPEINDNTPIDTREWTGADIASGVTVFFEGDYNPPDGLGSVYMHGVDLAGLGDVVLAFKAYEDNIDDSKFWNGLYFLMDDEDTINSSQTGSADSMLIHTFGDKGIIRVSQAGDYHEIGFAPHVLVDKGAQLPFECRIWEDGSGDTTPPSFDPADGGSLTFNLLPGFSSHFEFTAISSEHLFACPRYDIDFTTDDGEHQFYTINGVQDGDTTFEIWDDGELIYNAIWQLDAGLNGTADVTVTASDVVGNVFTQDYSDFLATGEVGSDGLTIGGRTGLEIPAEALPEGSRVTILLDPAISGGLLEARSLQSAPTPAKHLVTPAALTRGLALTPQEEATGEDDTPLGLHVVGSAYRLHSNAQLEDKATLRFAYDDEGVPNEDLLGLFRFDEHQSVWTRVEAQFDRQVDEAYASIDEFGLYAVGYTEAVSTQDLEEPESRLTFSLEQNFPNPYTVGDETSISFTTAEYGHVELRVFDLSGRLITTLVNEELPAGRHSITWNGSAQSGRTCDAGVYFYKLDTASNSATRRMVLVR